jgi:hypothetical protein
MVVFDEKPSQQAENKKETGSGPDHPVDTLIALTECSTIEDLFTPVL